MDPFLASDAWKELANDYNLAVGEVPQQSLKSLALSELLEGESCRAYINWLMRHIGAPNSSVAASMLVKRMGRLLVAPVLSAMSYHNQGIGMKLENCRLFHLDDSSAGTTFPFMTLSDISITAPDDHPRETWRAEVIRQLFADRLTPLMKHIAEAGSVSMAILWENVMVRIAPVYAHDENQDEEWNQRVRDDFFFLANEASGELYGMRKNPIASFTETREDDRLTGRSKRLTCCLYYQMAPEYCLKCPKL
ncbi:Ferric iron reductase protein FhuF, involved in iron transport [Paenibacillus catalpae]|uniref:Ferric iron reductase protein FhuF, involved in iron transport n=1 Tax=Paenibacillus catalpae TaxID=1045775 RepID=A0A1I2B5S0_9BACL|nr:IucA/IucC family C-terminal-domain containing protein [Paenibacillus catalpae]SFE51525.1 Ferric iron reductase protein FhuF, involved in iron transport [Paenibacillus catalpae]